MNIQLSDHFTYRKLIRFALAPIGSMLFTSLYSIVDGFFVSNYVGATAFASLNLVMPFIMLISGVGFMFGAGGSALVAQHLGMQEREKANRYFSLVVYTTIVLGLFLGSLGIAFAPGISRLLGATDTMLPYCILYLRINMIGIAFFMAQQLFQNFLIATERPKLGFILTLIAGCTNMVLDWLLVGRLRLGLAGAAWATILSQILGGVIPLILFLTRKDWILHLGKTVFEIRVIRKACGNGIGEFLTQASSSIVGFLFNRQLLRYAGENGVAAYGVIMYVGFIFAALFIGYTMGVAPVISYHDGARNRPELKNLFRKSLTLLCVTGIVLFGISELASTPMAKLFVGYDQDLYALTRRGFRIYAVSFLFMGFNIFGTAFFTALNNGKIAGILSVSRNLILQMIMIFLLPALFDTDGLWSAVIAVEAVSLILTLSFFRANGKRYGYR